MSEDSKDNKHDSTIELAKKRFKLAEDAERDIRTLALEDLKFASGEQWDSNLLNDRKAKGRPVLTINRIPQFVRQIINDIRQNKPSIKVSPVDDKADIETAKIYQGIIRHIEYSSFPVCTHDDMLDGMARILEPSLNAKFPATTNYDYSGISNGASEF